MEMERQLQDNVTKRLQAILEPEDLLFDEPMKDLQKTADSMLYSWTRQQSACQRQRF